jgi:hypothetical protein
MTVESKSVIERLKEIAVESKKDRRSVTSAINGRSGGRPLGPATPEAAQIARINGMKGGRPRIPLITPDLSKYGLEGKLPPKPVDLEEVFYWMDLGASEAEIAGAFHIGVQTLNSRLIEETGFGFSQLKQLVCGAAKLRLRRNQFNLTETNATMGIWLGKQWLGQKDNDEVKDSPNHEFIGQLISEIRALKGKLKELGALQYMQDEEESEPENVILLDGTESPRQSEVDEPTRP